MVGFAFHNIWWRLSDIGPMFCSFFIGGEKGVVEHWMNAPSFREEETRVGGCGVDNFKRAKSFIC